MSDTCTPQEPGEELKRLVAEIADSASMLTYYKKQDARNERLQQILAEGAQNIENYIQSRIPEVSEDARGLVSDLAKHGLRHDLHPTVNIRMSSTEMYEWWSTYLEGAENALKERCCALLSEKS